MGRRTRNTLLSFALSVLLVIPCFWHRSLQAGDLGSHVYNAWLVQLIDSGRAPGLRVAEQWNNVLFDFLLQGLGRFVSLELSGRIAASLAVLVFFWGSFLFLSALTRQPPWFLTPLIAIFAYGWTFNEGLFNYYLSVGLASMALAVLLRHERWRWAAVLFLPLILLAHPIGLAWFLGASACVALASVLPRRFHLLLLPGAAAILGILRFFLARRYLVEAPAHSVAFYNGFDQLVLTSRYAIPVSMMCVAFVAALAAEVRRIGASALLHALALPLELYAIVEITVALLPDAIYLRQYAAPLSNLSARLTLISAVLLCCLWGAAQPRKWHLLILAASAAIFFTFLFQDTALLQRMEDQVRSFVRSQPPGQRFILTIHQPLNYRLSAKHTLDLACVNYCFAYTNYEPPTGQFRVRAAPDNTIVMSDLNEAIAMEAGRLRVRPRDIPLYQIFSCGPTWTHLCLRPLGVGDTTDYPSR